MAVVHPAISGFATHATAAHPIAASYTRRGMDGNHGARRRRAVAPLPSYYLLLHCFRVPRRSESRFANTVLVITLPEVRRDSVDAGLIVPDSTRPSSPAVVVREGLRPLKGGVT